MSEVIRDVVIRLAIKQVDSKLKAIDTSAAKKSVEEYQAAGEKAAKANQEAAEEATEAIKKQARAQQEAAARTTEAAQRISEANIKAGDSFKAAGEGAFTMARGIALVGVTAEDDLKKTIELLAQVQGAFDIAKGGFEVFKGVKEGIRATEQAAAAATVANTALAASNTAVGTTSTQAAVGVTALKVAMNPAALGATALAAGLGAIAVAALKARQEIKEKSKAISALEEDIKRLDFLEAKREAAASSSGVETFALLQRTRTRRELGESGTGDTSRLQQQLAKLRAEENKRIAEAAAERAKLQGFINASQKTLEEAKKQERELRNDFLGFEGLSSQREAEGAASRIKTFKTQQETIGEEAGRARVGSLQSQLAIVEELKALETGRIQARIDAVQSRQAEVTERIESGEGSPQQLNAEARRLQSSAAELNRELQATLKSTREEIDALTIEMQRIQQRLSP